MGKQSLRCRQNHRLETMYYFLGCREKAYGLVGCKMLENEHVRITVEVHSESGTEHCTAILELGYRVTDAWQGNAYLELLAGKHKAQNTGQQITARIQ